MADPIIDSRAMVALSRLLTERNAAYLELDAVRAEVERLRADLREVRAHGWGATADTLQTMALAFARGVTDYATTDEPNGDLKTWDNVGLRSDGQPLWPDQWRQGVGATCSGMFRHWAQPLAWWVVARGSQDARARDHYERLRGEALASASTCLAWMPPL